MTKRLPATRPAPRIIYYPDPSPRPMVAYTPQQLAQQREDRALQYAQWRLRFDAIQERDRAVRRLLIRFAIAVFLLILSILAVAGWLIYEALSGVSSATAAHVGGAILGLLAVLILIGGGCGCITIVQHHH